MFFTLFAIFINLLILAACTTQPMIIANMVVHECMGFIGRTILFFYLGLLLYGGMTTLLEWKVIQISAHKKLLYLFTFPVFMFTYIPISAVALVRKVEWKPIYHGSDQNQFMPSRRKKEVSI